MRNLKKRIGEHDGYSIGCSERRKGAKLMCYIPKIKRMTDVQKS